MCMHAYVRVMALLGPLKRPMVFCENNTKQAAPGVQGPASPIAKRPQPPGFLDHLRSGEDSLLTASNPISVQASCPKSHLNR